MARAFMANTMTMSTKPAAAALTSKAGSGRDVQLKICIGMTVKGAMTQSNGPAMFPSGNEEKGAGGRKAMKVSAPKVTIGAVYPMARASPKMTPVRMPGIA